MGIKRVTCVFVGVYMKSDAGARMESLFYSYHNARFMWHWVFCSLCSLPKIYLNTKTHERWMRFPAPHYHHYRWMIWLYFSGCWQHKSKRVSVRKWLNSLGLLCLIIWESIIAKEWVVEARHQLQRERRINKTKPSCLALLTQVAMRLCWAWDILEAPLLTQK